jgi:hypothetical protein
MQNPPGGPSISIRVGFLVGFEDDRFQGTILHKSPTITHISRSINTKGKLDQAVAKRVRVIVLCRAIYIHDSANNIIHRAASECGIKSFHPGNTKEAACVRANRRSHRQRGRQDGGRTDALHPVSEQPKSMCAKAPSRPILFIASHRRAR